LASKQTDIYRDKFGWKWNKDSEIFLAPEFFARIEKHAGRFTGNDFKDRRAAGTAILRFPAEQSGRHARIVKLLNAHATHVVALSVSESTDAAIARIIVSDPERVEELFRENNIAFGVCELMVVELREVATQFIKILATLLMAEVNVHFSYPLLTRPNGRAALAMHVDDSECASSVLHRRRFPAPLANATSRGNRSGGTCCPHLPDAPKRVPAAPFHRQSTSAFVVKNSAFADVEPVGTPVVLPQI
jgi:hypothetical protein